MTNQDPSDLISKRAAAVAALAILDTPPEPAYDAVMRLLRRSLRAPMAGLSIVDGDRIFFKSEVGLNRRVFPSADSLSLAVVECGDFLSVADASVDERFSGHPLIASAPGVKGFYGCALRAPDRTPVGSLAVFDTEARSFDDNDHQALLDLAMLVERMMASRAPDSKDPLRALLQRRQSDGSHAQGAASRIPISLLVIKVSDSAGQVLLTEEQAKITNDLIFSQCRRAGDFIAPSDGNEFFAMLPNTDADGAKCIAERIQKALLESGLPGCERITIGAAVVATTKGFALGWSSWSDIADRSLFKAEKLNQPTAYVAELL